MCTFTYQHISQLQMTDKKCLHSGFSLVHLTFACHGDFAKCNLVRIWYLVLCELPVSAVFFFVVKGTLHEGLSPHHWWQKA